MRTEPLIRLDPRFTHLVTAGDAVILVGDEESVVVEDSRAGDVLTLLDGRRTAVDIAEALEERHRPEIVHYVLLRLLDEGVAVEVAADPGSEVPIGGLAGALRGMWEERGEHPRVDVPAAVWEGPQGCRLRLVDDYLRPELCDEARPAGSSAVPSLLAGMGTRRTWLGPVVGPDASCVVCLQDRLRLNLTGRAMVHDRRLPGDAKLGILTLPAEVPVSAWTTLAHHLPDRAEALADLTRNALVPRPVRLRRTGNPANISNRPIIQ